MKLGFTGTRDGMTEWQCGALLEVLGILLPEEFHHGDCMGADDEAADMVHELLRRGRPRGEGCRIVCHPPEKVEHRAYNRHFDREEVPRNHFARNRKIVDLTDALACCPKQMERQEQGGTWYTYDYAVKKGKRVYLILPSGDWSVIDGKTK